MKNMVRKIELYCRESLGCRVTSCRMLLSSRICADWDVDMAVMDTECGSIFQKESAFSGEPCSVWNWNLYFHSLYIVGLGNLGWVSVIPGRGISPFKPVCLGTVLCQIVVSEIATSMFLCWCALCSHFIIPKVYLF